MRFVKMQGIGNDYIYVFCAQGWPEGLPALARRLSDRHFGIGGDGLVLIAPGEETDFRMRMFNSDGSEGEMCGNAARCVGKYVHDRGLTDKTLLTLDTAAGLRRLELRLDEAGRTASVRVDMGTPRLRPEEIPMRAAGEPGEGIRLRTAARDWTVYPVSMGNPHAVVFCGDPEELELPAVGPALEGHPAFPERANVEFVQVCGQDRLRVRVWERGSGETLACGTGACAALVAAAMTGRCGRSAEVALRGGALRVSWEADGHVYQEGPAEFVFEGETLL